MRMCKCCRRKQSEESPVKAAAAAGSVKSSPAKAAVKAAMKKADEHGLAFASAVGNQLWPCLVEKVGDAPCCDSPLQ
jgi:hypothetical protein